MGAPYVAPRHNFYVHSCVICMEVWHMFRGRSGSCLWWPWFVYTRKAMTIPDPVWNGCNMEALERLSCPSQFGLLAG